MNIGDKLNKLILISKITKKELSDCSGVPLTTIDSIIRRNSKKVDCDTLQKLADALGVKIAYFFSRPSDNPAITLSTDECEIVLRHRFLDDMGKKLVDIVLNHEVSRVENIVNVKFEILTGDVSEAKQAEVDIDELNSAINELQ